jgi:diaminohydroxyphosphoribosylaminopyrimidine deaminase/5-amino-6-(5-phosphoribosylamino)uracil reductase
MGASEDHHRRLLQRAALLALRGHGRAEPNPMVGCVIVNDAGETVGWGYHREVGGPHAEIVALQRAGPNARGATVYCTLEPCNHHGRTGPCSQALIDAEVARVFVARRDPWPIAAGGIERLRAAGIDTHVIDVCSLATRVSQPFVHRLTTGLPWVTVKWAQTRDGAIALPASLGPRWISGRASRAMVHRERGRVDAILTGIGTVLADDPLLTPRGVRLRRSHRRPPRGMPLRVIVDPRLQTPLDSQLARTAGEVPTIIACADQSAETEAATRLRAAGAQLMPLPMDGIELPLATALKRLASQHDVTHVLTEAGPGLMRRLFQQRLANEAWVFTAPLDTGNDPSLPHVRGMLNDLRIEPWARQRRGDDAIARSWINTAPV